MTTQSTPSPGIFEGNQTQKSRDLAQEIHEAGALSAPETAPATPTVPPPPAEKVLSSTAPSSVAPAVDSTVSAEPTPAPVATTPPFAATIESIPDQGPALATIRQAAAANSLADLETTVFGEDAPTPKLTK